MSSVIPKSYWDGFARSYRNLGPPLRPSDIDVQFLEDEVAAWALAHPVERLQGTVFGVTPELARMRWPPGSWVLGVDSSFAMAQAVWPGDVPESRGVVCGNWVSLTRRDGSCHIVVGDGSIHCLRYPDGFRALADSVERVLADDGVLILRCYVQSDLREDPDDVYADLCSGSVRSFHAFKLRLLMAMQESADSGIAVRRV